MKIIITNKISGLPKKFFGIPFLFFIASFMSSFHSFASDKPLSSASLGGCTDFYGTYSNLTIDPCTRKVCFNARLKGADMHGVQNWHIDFGDGTTLDSTTTTNGNGGIGTWGGITGIWDTLTLTVCHTYASAGNYNITLSVTPAHTTCLLQFPITIPTGSPLTVNSSTICPGTSTTLTASGSTTYSWSTGATTTSISVSPSTTSTYSVWPGGGGGCTSGTVATVVVTSALSNFTSNVSCNGVANFIDGSSAPGSTISSWSWSFPGGSPPSSTTQNPTGITYSATGTYTVTLTVTSANGCTATITQTIVVSASLIPAVTSATVCPGGSATLTASGGTSYTWSTGGTSSSIVANPTVTTNYSVTVTDGNGCIGTATTSITMNPPPTVQFTSTPVCEGNPTVFSGTSSINPVTWSWSFPGGTPATSASQNPTVTFPAGTYSATVVITTAGGCTATVTQPVTVNPLPVANMKGPNVCFNNVTAFKDLSTGNTTLSSWAWNFGDANTSTAQNPTHTYANPGTYAVTLTVTNTFGCVSTNTITVVVNPLPVASFSSLPVCLHDSTCFTNLSSISAGTVTGWSWNFGDAASGAHNISNQKNPCHTFTGIGPFTVILTVTSDSGCQSTTSLPATLNPIPIANFSATPPCLGAPTVFTDLSTVTPPAITAWSWDFGDGTTSALQNPTHIYLAAGSYTATLVVTSSKGCKDTVLKPVIVYNLPIAGFANPDSGCAPVCKTFLDTSQAGSGSVVSWQWSFPGGSPASSTVQNGSSCWNKPGSYDVQLIVTNTFGCKDTLYIANYINVFPWPKADFCVSPEQAPATEPVFNFCPLWSPNPGVTNWVWNFGDTSALDSVSTNPVHSYSATATQNDWYSYNICLKVQNQHGCWDTICKPVELVPYFTFYIANCVTPNQDGTNELFFGKGRGIKDYNIWLFDRWGNQIWDCHYQGKNTDWDNAGQDGMPAACKWDCIVVPGGLDMGGNSGQLAQEDVYVWKVRLTDIFDKIHDYIGHVSVVK